MAPFPPSCTCALLKAERFIESRSAFKKCFVYFSLPIGISYPACLFSEFKFEIKMKFVLVIRIHNCGGTDFAFLPLPDGRERTNFYASIYLLAGLFPPSLAKIECVHVMQTNIFCETGFLACLHASRTDSISHDSAHPPASCSRYVAPIRKKR